MHARITAWIRRHALLLVVCAAVTIPIWLVRFPPLQDFPVHYATIRVLHDFHDPAFAFDRDFELTLGRTQYVGFYAVAHVLAYAFGPRGALLALLAFYLAGTVAALRSLVVALGRDERLAFASVTILYGALTAIGLMPFLVATPVCLWALALLVRRRDAPSAKHDLAIAVLGIVLFYLHVIHLGVFLVGAVVLFPFRASTAARIRAALAHVPTGIALGWWLFGTNVGRRVFEVTTHWGSKNRPALGSAIGDLHVWVADAYPDPSDEIVFVLAILAFLYASWLVWRETKRGDGPVLPRLRGYWILPLVCLLLYLTGERSRGAIWPLAQRYMLPAVLLAAPLLGMPREARARARASLAILLVGGLTIANAAYHFVAFDREVGDFRGALSAMDPGKHVASLVYRPYATASRFWPFLHFGSYYQAERGGVVWFSFAGYDQWPIDFKRDRYPLFDGPATPRWEFFPADVVEHQPLASYFDYVVAAERGDAAPPPGFHLVWKSGGDAGRMMRWEVFARDAVPSGAK